MGNLFLAGFGFDGSRFLNPQEIGFLKYFGFDLGALRIWIIGKAAKKELLLTILNHDQPVVASTNHH